jgi:hypothetical protein
MTEYDDHQAYIIDLETKLRDLLKLYDEAQTIDGYRAIKGRENELLQRD